METIFSKKEKEGNMFIQQILVFPIFFVTICLIIQLILFSYSNSQMNTAAENAAATISHHLRGNPILAENADAPGDLHLDILTETTADSLLEVGKERIITSSNFNSFILFDKDKDGNDMTSNIAYAKDSSECETALSDNSRALCVFLKKEGGTGGTDSYQVIVRAKAPFNLIGNFIPILGEDIAIPHVYGNSSSVIDMPGRFQYY